jgi:hypothetical protein
MNHARFSKGIPKISSIANSSTRPRQPPLLAASTLASQHQEGILGRGVLLWLLGVPIPIIILIALLYH